MRCNPGVLRRSRFSSPESVVLRKVLSRLCNRVILASTDFELKGTDSGKPPFRSKQPGRRTCYTLPMRRVLFLLMLVILPLQSVWAAAAVYCRHETGLAAKHLGHHDHEHMQARADGKADQKSGTMPAPGADTDCSICHLSTAPSLASASGTTVASLDAPPQFAYQRSDLSHIAPGPERPDRASLA